MATAAAEMGRSPYGNVDTARIGDFLPGILETMKGLVHIPEGHKPHEIPDGYRGLRGVLVTGNVGVGKTALATMIAEELDTYNVMVFGKVIRGLKTGALGHISRPFAFDQALEKAQQQVIKVSSTAHPLVADGRCAPLNMAWLRKKEEAKQEKKIQSGTATIEDLGIPYSDVICVLLTAPDEVRDERLVKREQKDKPGLSASFILSESKKRAQEDEELYRKLHPLIGRHPVLGATTPYDPRLTDYAGRPLFDIVIDTAEMTLEQERDLVKKRLQGLGFYVPEKKPKRPSPPRRQVLYQRDPNEPIMMD